MLIRLPGLLVEQLLNILGTNAKLSVTHDTQSWEVIFTVHHKPQCDDYLKTIVKTNTQTYMLARNDMSLQVNSRPTKYGITYQS